RLWHSSGTFLKWAVFGAIILFLPVLIYFMMNKTIWAPVQLLFYLGTFIYLYHVKIGKVISLLSKQSILIHVKEGFGAVCLIAVWYSGKQPMISLLFIIGIWLFIRYRTFFQYPS